MPLPPARPVVSLRRLAEAMTVVAAMLGWFESTLAQDSAAFASADYLAQFNSVNVNNKIDRVPGISVTLNAGAPSGGAATSNSNVKNRGLGTGAQILIDGKPLAGKDNEAGAQPSRLAAAQVRHIEIIRATSRDMPFVWMRTMPLMVHVAAHASA